MATPKLNRLERLVIVLDEVRTNPEKAKEFDLEEWSEDIPGCGTHLCACGWGAVDSVLSGQGFRLVSDGSRRRDLTFTDSKGKVWQSFDAVTRFFGIGFDDAYNLFAKDHYKDKTKIEPVIKRIRGFINKTRAARARTK